ncbi:MAG: acylphosphatase [Myxococcota bacterium]|nr:acylphosphatase [Myxococcota bacterium]
MTRKAIQLLIEGKVQGVGYRAWTKRTAESLGLFGWVRNLTDGRVEIHAEGDAKALKTLTAACEQGPRYAEVLQVQIAERPDWNLIEFEQVATVSPP